MRFLGLALLLAQAAASDEVYQDFRGKELNPAVFRQEGPSAPLLLKPEPEGLRITLPAEGIARPVGISFVVPLKGDFEVTTRYEFLRLERPNGGFGAGFSIYVATDSPTKEALEFFHFVRPSGAEAYGCAALTTRPDGRRGIIPGAVTGDFPAQGKSGQMRVTRVGPEVSLSAAPEGESEFKTLYRFNLGSADVTLVRLAATPGNAPNPVDLRVRDLRIRQKGITLPAEPETGKRSSLWIALLLALVLLLAALVAWYYRRRVKKISAAIAPEL
jgi:LPXTG-motif cell wall-anchored protein